MGFGQSRNYSHCRVWMSTVRLVHNVASDLVINICLNGMMRSRNIRYMDVSDYLEIEPGMHHLRIYNAANNQCIKQLTTTVKICRNKSYTIIVSGLISDPSSLKLLPIEESNEPISQKCPLKKDVQVIADVPVEVVTPATAVSPASIQTEVVQETIPVEATKESLEGRALVRFIHAAAMAFESGVDVWARAPSGDVKLFSNFKYQEASKYLIVDPGLLSLVIAPTNGLDGIGPLDLVVEANRRYTLIATGLPEDSRYPISVIKAADKTMTICLYDKQ